MERREFPRTSIEPLEIVIEEINSSKAKYENVTLVINEVSQDGVKFTTNIEFSADEIIRCHLPSLDIATLILGKITWKKEVGMNRFQYGLKIIE